MQGFDSIKIIGSECEVKFAADGNEARWRTMKATADIRKVREAHRGHVGHDAQGWRVKQKNFYQS